MAKRAEEDTPLVIGDEPEAEAAAEGMVEPEPVAPESVVEKPEAVGEVPVNEVPAKRFMTYAEKLERNRKLLKKQAKQRAVGQVPYFAATAEAKPKPKKG